MFNARADSAPPNFELAPLDIALVQQSLSANGFGNPLYYLHDIGSTNTHLRELAESGAPEGAIVVAESQTHGRGRLGRRWESPAFANLYLSILLRPTLVGQKGVKSALSLLLP